MSLQDVACSRRGTRSRVPERKPLGADGTLGDVPLAPLFDVAKDHEDPEDGSPWFLGPLRQGRATLALGRAGARR